MNEMTKTISLNFHSFYYPFFTFGVFLDNFHASQIHPRHEKRPFKIY